MKAPLTIEDTQKGLLNKDFSTVELVDEYLRKIKKESKLNAFITVTEEEAYKKAKETDKLISIDKEIEKDNPLFGVTVAYKDLFLTKGVRTTADRKSVV